MEDLRVYQIALKNITGVGAMRARALIDHFGGLVSIFEVDQRAWMEVLTIGPEVLKRMSREKALDQAYEELAFIEQAGLEVLFFNDPRYPNRLKHCSDAPILLYANGRANLNPDCSVGIIGTRNATPYGKRVTQELVEGLVPFDPLIVSGLALGVDTLAHDHALRNGLSTAAVLGHSLDRIYPTQNHSLSNRILQNGMLLSEFNKGTKPDRENFPQRNRIVAGMVDVVIVIETGIKGGSMITTSQALSYNRDVCAFPGEIFMEQSAGCHQLIKRQQAHLIEGVDDLANVMGWDRKVGLQNPQKQLFVDLDDLEKVLVAQLKGKMSIDNLSIACAWPISVTSNTLLGLEFKGVVKALPGKMFMLT